MTVALADIQFRLSTTSGTAGDQTASTPAACLGKYMSTTSLASGVLGNLHRGITAAEGDEDVILYKCFFILNNNPTDTAYQVTLWFEGDTIKDSIISYGLDPAGAVTKNQAGAQAAQIANETVAPVGVTFVRPYDASNVDALIDIGPNKCVGVWVRLRVPANSYAEDLATIQLRARWVQGFVYARPISDIDNSDSWTEVPASGPVELFNKINETSPDDDTTYVASPSSTAALTDFEVKLGTVTDPLTKAGHTIRVRTKRSAGTIVGTVKLMQGATELVSAVLLYSGSWGTITYPLAQRLGGGGITDYSDLRLRISADPISVGHVGQVTWVELEVPTTIETTTILLRWSIAPSEPRVDDALRGARGTIVYNFTFEKRNHDGTFLQDISNAFVGGSINLANNRPILRTATFTIDPTLLPVDLDPLRDHVGVVMNLQVDDYWLSYDLGLFHLNIPKITHTPTGDMWSVDASDLCIHLAGAYTTAPYTVSASTNYITAVKTILDAQSEDLVHSLPVTTLTTPNAMTWPRGTPWIEVVNDLLRGANMYPLWARADGVLTTREWSSLAQRTPDTEYSESTVILSPFTSETDLAFFANQIIAIAEDPNRSELYSIKTNADPSSPISTVSLGRTITKKVSVGTVASQSVLNEIAQKHLEDAAGSYKKARLVTTIDPRREAHEVYSITVGDDYVDDKWWAFGWTLPLKVGGQMTHEIGHVEKVLSS